MGRQLHPFMAKDLMKDKVMKNKNCEIKHIKQKLWSLGSQLSQSYASQYIEGALELVVNCISLIVKD